MRVLSMGRALLCRPITSPLARKTGEPLKPLKVSMVYCSIWARSARTPPSN